LSVTALLIGLVPSFGSLPINSIVNAQNPSSQKTTPQPVITGYDTDKETNDASAIASTQTSDDHNTKADTETNDDQKSGVTDDHNTIADPETNDGG
jgi:hypothetical protein